MRVAILETVKTQAGFEQEFDRLIIDELKKQGHTPVLYLPEHSSLPVDFGVSVEYLAGGEIIDYEGAGRLKKIWLSVQRERRRVRWFNAAYAKVCRGEIDAIILTTATYRYLRSLHKSKLRESTVPVIFIFLGVNPQEKPKFMFQAKKCLAYKNIQLKITSLRNDFTGDGLANVKIIPPPVLVPSTIKVNTYLSSQRPIKIGFFGHYRQGEKDVAGIIKAFVQANTDGKASLVVQFAPSTAADAQDLEAILKPYAENPSVEIIRGKLAGETWYKTLQAMDVLFLPYSDPRYLYNWSAVYFNALGLYKPVLTTKYLNPEILAHYDVGAEVDLTDTKILSQQFAHFLDTYAEKLPQYQQELVRVNHDFSTQGFLENLLK